jgi:hypothetical protein
MLPTPFRGNRTFFSSLRCHQQAKNSPLTARPRSQSPSGSPSTAERAGPLWDPARVRQQNHPEILKISVGFSDVRAEERRLMQRGAAQSPLVNPEGLRLCSKLHKVQVKSKFIVATSA